MNDNGVYTVSKILMKVSSKPDGCKFGIVQPRLNKDVIHEFQNVVQT